MNRKLLLIISFWVLLLSPGLCLAGALEHLCDDSPQEATCNHEDDCASDPCSGEVLRPDSSTSQLVISVDGAPVQDRLDAQPGFLRTVPFLDTLFFPDRANLPRPASDLPLLS